MKIKYYICKKCKTLFRYYKGKNKLVPLENSYNDKMWNNIYEYSDCVLCHDIFYDLTEAEEKKLAEKELIAIKDEEKEWLYLLYE